LLDAAQVIVIAPFPIGPANLANLEDAAPYAERRLMFCVRSPPVETRDYTGGAAVDLYHGVVAKGASEIDGPEELLVRLASLPRDPPRSGPRRPDSPTVERADVEGRRAPSVELGDPSSKISVHHDDHARYSDV
jgi:hypothetical protein